MKIPITGRKKCLLVVDVIKSFIMDRNKNIIPCIEKIINNIEYDLIVFSAQYNHKDSMWVKQVGWNELLGKVELPYEPLLDLVKDKNYIIINKVARSCFKANYNLEQILKENDIKEVHITGYESNDCVLATAFDSIDLGFYTFVIEEASETGKTALNHEKAISILNYLKLTNNSDFVDSKNTDFKIL